MCQDLLQVEQEGIAGIPGEGHTECHLNCPGIDPGSITIFTHLTTTVLICSGCHGYQGKVQDGILLWPEDKLAHNTMLYAYLPLSSCKYFIDNIHFYAAADSGKHHQPVLCWELSSCLGYNLLLDLFTSFILQLNQFLAGKLFSLNTNKLLNTLFSQVWF